MTAWPDLVLDGWSGLSAILSRDPSHLGGWWIVAICCLSTLEGLRCAWGPE